MIGLDTNVLARYYIRDEGDAGALKQREAARRLMESGKPLIGRRARRMGLAPRVVMPE